MSGSSDGLQPTIHIPLCSNKKCKEGISQLAAALKDEGLKCITEYNVYGKYKTWFEESFVKCDFTIIHQCPHLWERIKRCHEVLSNEMKIMVVDFVDDCHLERGHNDAKADPEFVEFFHDRMVQIITDAESRQNFVGKIISSTKKPFPGYCHSSVQSETLSSAYNLPVVANPSTASSSQERKSERFLFSDDEEVEKETLERYPDIFGERKLAVSVRSEVLQYTVVPISYTTTDECMMLRHQIDKFKDMNNDQRMSHTKYILYEVLPSLYKNNCILGLTIIAGCNQPLLQERALTLVKLMLLERRGPEHNMDLSTLIKVEGVLSVLIADLHKEFANSMDCMLMVPIQRLAIVYLMLLCEMIVTSTQGSDMQICDMYIRTISGRPFCYPLPPVNEPDCLKITSVVLANHDISPIDAFVKDVNGCSCTSVREWVVRTLDPENHQRINELADDEFFFQVIIVFELLKKVFRTFDRTYLNDLAVYVRKSITSYYDSDQEILVCRSMLFRSLALFLSYGLRQDTNYDLQQICHETMDIFYDAYQRSLSTEIGRLMQALLYNNEPVIRRGIRKVFPDQNNDKTVSYLLQEVEKELCPILTLDKNKQRHMLRFPKEWLVTPAQFNNKSALIHICQNNKESAMHEHIHHVELRTLQHLQHKNIIQLFAYQKTSAMCFYIVENYQENNLQTALNKQNVRQAHFTKSQLYGFLVDACCALEYCHSKGYVHRNLTANSCFLTSGNTVKLCGFHSCLPLVSAEKKAMELNSPGIPTRWSAPESLHRDEYSTASDVWMVGHLMFEILTHGLLPYSHIKKSDSEIVQLIIKNQANLFLDPRIEPRSYDVIIQCTQNDPEQRPSVSEIKCKLEDFIGSAMEGSTFEFPDLTSVSRKPSTEYELGNPSYKCVPFESYPEERYEIISNENASTNPMIQLKLTDRYIFKEKILRNNFSNEMLVTLHSGDLNSILPPIRVLITTERSQHIEYSIPLSCLGNLHDLTLERWLGETVGPYVRCLYEVAIILERLNKASCILGDMCASNLFIEQKGNTYKVHVVSLACMSDLKNPYQGGKLPAPLMSDVLHRTAPEVLRPSCYSPSSDVFCFGVLMWEVLTMFDGGENCSCLDKLALKHAANKDIDEVYEQLMIGEWKERHKKPECCSDNLWELINLCVDVISSRRPTIPHLVKLLHTYCTQDLGLTISSNEVPMTTEAAISPFSESNPSVASSSSSVIRFSERNTRSTRNSTQNHGPHDH